MRQRWSLRLSVIFLMSLFMAASSPGAYAQQWADDMFDVKNVDFGTVVRGASVRQKVTVTNKYLEPVHISRIERSCGCTEAIPSQETLKTYERASIEIVMDTVKFQGLKQSAITVHFDKPFPATVRIPVQAMIRQDLMVTPGNLSLGKMVQGTPGSGRVSVTYYGSANWQLTGVRSASPFVNAQLSQPQRYGNSVIYNVDVTLKPDSPVGDLRSQLMLETTDPANKQVMVLVEGAIERPFAVQPEIATLGSLAPGQKKTLNVIVRGARPFVITGVTAVNGEGIEFGKPQGSRQVHVLPITFSAPAAAMSLDQTCTIQVEGYGDPVTFRLTGRVEGAQASR